MRNISYMVAVVALVTILFAVLSPAISATSANPCGSCHGSYYQYLDLLEGNSANQIPITINVGETKTVTILIENRVNAPRYTSLSSVAVSLSSQNGHFSVNAATFNVGDLPTGTKTATWQITGVSAGADALIITARGTNSHQNRPFSDSYAPSPTITVSQSTPPSPSPTPTSTPTSTPTPSPTPAPTATSSPTDSPTPTPTPAPTSAPTPTANPSPNPQPTPAPEPTPTNTPHPQVLPHLNPLLHRGRNQHRTLQAPTLKRSLLLQMTFQSRC